jgi:uncharacterized Tic20 family protein
MSLVEDLRRLDELRQAGAIDDQEYAQAKARLLRPAGSPRRDPVEFDEEPEDANREAQVRQWALLLHLSQFAGYAIPLGGLILPIVIWQLKKSEFPEVDAHGKVVANWIVSELIYGVMCLFLFFVLIGIPLMIVLFLLSVVFPVIGAIKANQGEVWKYPLSMTIFQ